MFDLILYSFVGMFYYVLGNIRPELRSTTRTIQLIACVESPILSKYGFTKVLEPFVKDVNTLSLVRNIPIRKSGFILYVLFLGGFFSGC